MVVNTLTGGVVAERTMFWGDQWYGGHTGKAIQRAGTSWYLAEGAANDFFATFILLANPSNATANVTVTFLLEPSGTVTKTYAVRGQLAADDLRQRLHRQPAPARSSDESFSTRVTSDQPIGVERAMYFSERAGLERRA